MRKITIPAFTKQEGCREITLHGPIEIVYDERQFRIVETEWNQKKDPAYAIERVQPGGGGPIVAMIPTRDPDSIWAPGEEQFDTFHYSYGIVNNLRPEGRWRKPPLSITFRSPIPSI